MSSTSLNSLLPDDLFAHADNSSLSRASWVTNDTHFFGRERRDRSHPAVPTLESVKHFVLDRRWEPQIKMFVRTGKPLALTGPKGSGKTLFSRWIAHQLGLPYYEINHSSQFEFADVLTIDVQDSDGRWKKVDGKLVHAFRHGGVYCGDEMWASRASELQNYHPFLTNQRVTIRGRADEETIVERSEDFFFIATGNDWKNTLGNFEPGDPLLDRFTFIMADYIDADTERNILVEQTDIVPEIAKDLTAFAAAWRAGQKHNPDSVRYTVSTRKLVDLCNMMEIAGTTLAEAVEIEILAPARLKYPEDVESLTTVLRSHLGPDIGA
jgi:MoxR-like ATPase